MIQTAAWSVLCLAFASPLAADDELGESGFVDSDGVKIHYVTAGDGPLVVLIHGFPDFWYTWREQMPALAKHFKVVAIDQRGYNKSDKPEGVENYTVDKLVGDVDAVVRHFIAPDKTWERPGANGVLRAAEGGLLAAPGRDKAIIVGHDWGGLVAWRYAMLYPDRTERLVILNLPHPKGLMRELANNPQQQKNSQYARNFQQPDAASKLRPELLAAWVIDPKAREKYVEAFRRSSIEAMLNYYKANYPREPYADAALEFPKVKCPVLMFHGLKDPALLPGALNGTWDWVEKDLTLITLPDAGHFVQQDAAQTVTRNMISWLTQR